jgi:hypothetical protein
MLDQAIAVDWLITRCGRTDEALLGLWLAGYRVDAAKARRAWIQQLKRVQHRRRKAAERYSVGFFGLGRSWWKKLRSTKAFDASWWRERPDSDQELLGDFMADTEEWLRDDSNRDDESYRNQVAELVVRLANADRRGVYAAIDSVWEKFDPASIFAVTPSIELVKSMSRRELDAAQRSVAHVASMLSHALQLVSGPTDHIPRVIAPLALMRGFLGASVVKALFLANEVTPRMPLGETISTLHGFVMRVQSTDIAKKNDYSLEFSERMRIEWQAARKQLSELWITARKQSANQAGTLNGPADPASG